MKKEYLSIQGIPAVLWGEPSDRLYLVVHGLMSNKEDDGIAMFAEEATVRGYQALSFDLPEHGDRKEEGIPCKVQGCVKELAAVLQYAQPGAKRLSLFSNSLGAYFSLLAFRDTPLERCLLFSPILNMELLIRGMMAQFGVSEERLQAEQEIQPPYGPALYWDYLCYVKEHPVERWDKPTAILYGAKDNLTPRNVVSDFTERFHCSLTVLEDAEHYFHTDEDLRCLRKWIVDNI